MDKWSAIPHGDRAAREIERMDSQTLLIPLPGEHACGEDVTYDPKFIELEALIAGKPETQFSAAEEPDWKAVREACLGLLARSKNLRIAALLCLARVKLEGITGLRDGLGLIKGLLEQYWAEVFPKLDPAENNDPLERINIISSLSTPLGTFGDPFRFLERVRQIPLTNSPQLGRMSLAGLAGQMVAGQAPPTAAQFVAAMRDTPAPELEATFQAVADSLAHVRAIDDFLTKTVGTDKAPDMGALIGVLTEIEKTLLPHVPGASAADAGTPESSAVAAAGASAGGQAANSGAITSRQDVVRALERICEYYARHESSSPVPLLLQRARRLVDMDFMQIVSDLAPDALGQINVVTGNRASTGDAQPT